MGTLERTETLTHRIGADGRVSVKTIGGVLRVRGVEGEEARLTVAYRIRATDQAAAERALESGRVLIDRGPGSLEVETPERRLSTGLAWLFGGARVNANMTVEIPWGARVRLETMSGSIDAGFLVGDQKYRTVSGDIRLWALGGLVESSTISGSIALDRGGDLRLRANTVSGGIQVRAARFHGMVVSSTSGSIGVVGAMDPSGDYRAESISGSVTLTPLCGVTAELRSISGSIVSDLPQRMEGGRGFWRAIVGDGKVLFRANSTSGGLRLHAPTVQDLELAGTAQAAPTASTATASAAPVASAGASTPTAPVGQDYAAARAPQDAPTVPEGETAPDDTGSESWNPDETADDASDELAVLQALERGEIGVDEAAERLERVRR